MEDRQLRLRERTFEEVRDLVAAGVWAFLPVGATEAHGPHLPVVTDATVAEAAALRAARSLAYDRIPSLVLPPVTYGVSERAGSLPGTVAVGPETLTGLVHDVVISVVHAGFLGVVVCNAQLDEGHRAALHRAVELARAARVAVAFPDITQEPHASRVDPGFHTGECHAGRVETSLVLGADPFVVREERLHGLLPNPPPSASGAQDGRRRRISEIGGPLLYVGDPASATSAEGVRVLDQLAAVFADAARELKVPS